MEVIILLYYFGSEDRGQRTEDREEWEKLREKEREENSSTSSLPYLRTH
jgi:hypothetical protein